MRPVDDAVLVERISVEMHDILPVAEQLTACGAAAPVTTL
jgi:hypothetical protein